MHLLLWLFALAIPTSTRAELQTVYEWKYLDFLWDSEEHKQNAVRLGDYNFSRVLPSDVAVAKDGRVFLSHIGYGGVPARLSTVSSRSEEASGPLLSPYPDWSWHAAGDCGGITSVYGLAIDQCNRLWVLDTGILEHETRAKACQAQLLAFDLTRNQLAKRIKIPNHIAQNDQGLTRLVKPIVETRGQQCGHTTVYMTDSVGHGLVIWNGIGLFRLEGEVYNPIESARNVTSGGGRYLSLGGGVADMSLTPQIFPYEPRYLFFRPLASYDLYAANTRELTRSVYGYRIKYFGARDILASQALGQAFSSDGTLFLGLSAHTAIACWNRYRELARDNIEIVAQDTEKLQYASGVKVVPKAITKTLEELWVLSNRFIHFQLGALNFSDVNYRILKSPVKDLVEGTRCELPASLKAALHRRKTTLSYKYPK